MVDCSTMIEQDTIAAISTPRGTGAIAIVRMSGLKTYTFLEKIFSTSSKKFKKTAFQKAGSHKVIHGYIHSPTSKQIIDEVVLVNNFAPNSYTGEDLVEINCHGNPLIADEILFLLIDAGARLAQPGEFTKRAFLNGKLDLTQAESVLDLIQAKTKRQRNLSLSALEGHLGKRILKIRESLMNLLTKLVAGIDFPEEVGELPADDIESAVNEAIKDLKTLAETSRSGRFLREGLKLSLVGRPNAGKSSLLNLLLNYDRAIVSDTPGTTRDSIEELIDIKGIPVTLIDTAGVRITDDAIEMAGIERTTRAIRESDLALFMIDSTVAWGAEEEKILELVASSSYVSVINKIDLPESSLITTDNHEHSVDQVRISAQTKEGLEELTAVIERFALSNSALTEAGATLNQRQSDLCKKAIESLNSVKEAVSLGMLEDCVATDLKSAIGDLSNAIGDELTEEVIDHVFERFCIGK